MMATMPIITKVGVVTRPRLSFIAANMSFCLASHIEVLAAVLRLAAQLNLLI